MTLGDGENDSDAVIDSVLLGDGVVDTVPERHSVWLPVGDSDAESEREKVAHGDDVDESVPL